MQSSTEIIKEYKTADSEKRLYLFLECPGLRTEFIEIDQCESEPTFRPYTPGKKHGFRLLRKMTCIFIGH